MLLPQLAAFLLSLGQVAQALPTPGDTTADLTSAQVAGVVPTQGEMATADLQHNTASLHPKNNLRGVHVPLFRKPGYCRLHLRETKSCAAYLNDFNNLSGEVALFDHKDNPLAYDKLRQMNDRDPYFAKTPLSHQLWMRGEHRGDLVQFHYGDQHWTSRTDIRAGRPQFCKVGAWDQTKAYCKIINDIHRDMDCWFPCPYEEVLREEKLEEIRDYLARQGGLA